MEATDDVRVKFLMKLPAQGNWIGRAAVWFALLGLVTVVLHAMRAHANEQAQAILIYLLVVLGASRSGGRILGFVLAAASFLLIDYYFQQPFDTLSIAKPLDLTILLAYFAVALTTTDLLSRAVAEAASARARLEEIERLSAEASHAAALREAAKLRDVLLASVSHDLRTPLTTIGALAQISAAAGDENARLIVAQADRLGRMVSDMLDLSRINAGGFPMAPELNTAEDLMGAAVQQIAGTPGAARVRVDIDYSQPALLGTFDFVQSLRIVTNLLDNALRYSPAVAPVTLSARRDGDWLLFRVEDAGPGVPEADRERIFQLFYRGADAATHAGGSGLGLAIGATLAAAQGGRLTYSPANPGGGSVFTVYLPAANSG